jgi:hypothetical protein
MCHRIERTPQRQRVRVVTELQLGGGQHVLGDGPGLHGQHVRIQFGQVEDSEAVSKWRSPLDLQSHCSRRTRRQNPAISLANKCGGNLLGSHHCCSLC